MSNAGLHLSLNPVQSIPEALRLRSQEQGNELAYVFLHDGEEPAETMTFSELDRAAEQRAVVFAAAGLAEEPALLLYRPGLEFIRSLLGCMYGGVASAPVQVPRHRQGLAKLRRIADDAGTRTVLTTAAVKEALQDGFGGLPELDGITLLATDSIEYAAADLWSGPWPESGDIALLQYTSGSTRDPKGVMVSHGNFLANIRETEELWPCGDDGTFVNWLPLFHDMGMMFGVVLPLWAGATSYLMAPESFIRRPARWPEAIARFGGTHAAAPNFAYEVCVRAAAEGKMKGVADLSKWRVAVNGAEPVRWQTLQTFAAAFAGHGFDPRAMCPGYGLAENTLKATGSQQDREPTAVWLSINALAEGRLDPRPAGDGATTPVVSCGIPAPGTEIRIVRPDTREVCPPDRVGEIWISGPCVAEGYWLQPDSTEETFHGRLADPVAGSSPTYLRTGDLGFLHDGELYVTGRFKDIIVHQGRNYYPQDIELSAENSVDGLHPNCAAAFCVDDGTRESLILVVELDGRVLKSSGAAVARRRILEAVWAQHRLAADTVLIVRRGALPKTSSGKIQRQACRKNYMEGGFTDLAGEFPVDSASVSATQESA